jgi:hypothetical protein
MVDIFFVIFYTLLYISETYLSVKSLYFQFVLGFIFIHHFFLFLSSQYFCSSKGEFQACG